MNGVSRQDHWENINAAESEDEVSWLQGNLSPSLELIAHTGVNSRPAIVDIGGGAPRSVDSMEDMSFQAVTVLDLSKTALSAAKARLGSRADQVEWVVADVTTWESRRVYDLWHDRATFHFLTKEQDRTAYVTRLTKAVKPDGHAIFGTFAPDGPAKGSSLFGPLRSSAFWLPRRLQNRRSSQVRASLRDEPLALPSRDQKNEAAQSGARPGRVRRDRHKSPSEGKFELARLRVNGKTAPEIWNAVLAA